MSYYKYGYETMSPQEVILFICILAGGVLLMIFDYRALEALFFIGLGFTFFGAVKLFERKI